MSDKKSRKLEKSSTIFLDVKRLRARRKELKPRKKVIQDDIAQIVGIERTTYVGYEKRAEFEVLSEHAEAIAKLLETTVDDIKSHEKVETSQHHTNFRHQIFEGDYIGMHKRAWDLFEETLRKDQDLLKDLATTIKNLTQAGGRRD